ncbi:hypothetical protein TW95_gp0027 [Pandoravirus inopinatum]|uniref:Uncharacterized protein n=1 Tax=Pandoravirus inopinatum TaxID=1605721 RepID=A0A0B5J7N7_9VIRU|nr:hypothetical protein TW95_gp0027 [Pandoravirus inopinatum]AJF96761.1 hypothetical protein [Pandoravirus inopinatum]
MTSGASSQGVPQRVIVALASLMRANPKSATLDRESSVTSRLDDLRSRCTVPAAPCSRQRNGRRTQHAHALGPGQFEAHVVEHTAHAPEGHKFGHHAQVGGVTHAPTKATT